MCDQKFKFCENQPTNVPEKEEDNNLVNKPPKKNIKKNETQEQNWQTHHSNVICNQPSTCVPHHQSCSSNYPKYASKNSPSFDNTVDFNSKTSTLNFPPSFNLRSDKKSTPAHQTRFQITPSSSPLNKTRSRFTPKQTQTDTKIEIEVHQNNEPQHDNIQVDDTQSNETFHSM